MLLQVLDDGRLTDGQGRTVDFRNTLIVMTSNLGAEYLVAQAEGEDIEAVRDQVMAEVRAHFRPEFLNRVDEIILFHRLKREQMGRIVDIQIERLQKLLEDRKITVALDAKAREWLAEKGYDPAYGARPLKRTIQKSVQDPLAELILSGRIKDGEKVKISAGRDGLWCSTARRWRRRRNARRPLVRWSLAHVLDEIARRPFGRPRTRNGLSPPELSTLMASQKKPRTWVTSAICDIGKCSSVRRHGVSQYSDDVGGNADMVGDHAGREDQARQIEVKQRPQPARTHLMRSSRIDFRRRHGGLLSMV